MDLAVWLPIVFALLATGVFAGILAGLLGVGGGIVIVPVLYFVFQGLGVEPSTAMLVATGTSLATIVPTSVSSMRAHHRKGNVDWALFQYFAPFMAIAVLVGGYLVTQLDGTIFSVLFGVIAILAALNMLFRANAPAVWAELPGKVGKAVLAAVIGFFSVMVGIGGGTMSVPILTAFNYPAHRAVGTAAAFGLLIALPGAVLLLVAGTAPGATPVGTYGLVNLPGFLIIVPLTVLCAPLGATLGAKLNSARLKQVFAVVLTITGARMLLQVAGIGW